MSRPTFSAYQFRSGTIIAAALFSPRRFHNYYHSSLSGIQPHTSNRERIRQSTGNVLGIQNVFHKATHIHFCLKNQTKNASSPTFHRHDYGIIWQKFLPVNFLKSHEAQPLREWRTTMSHSGFSTWQVNVICNLTPSRFALEAAAPALLTQAVDHSTLPFVSLVYMTATRRRDETSA